MGSGHTEANETPQNAEDRVGRRKRTQNSKTERPKYASEEPLICNSDYKQYINIYDAKIILNPLQIKC